MEEANVLIYVKTEGFADPEYCGCDGVSPCWNCGAHIGCPCHGDDAKDEEA